MPDIIVTVRPEYSKYYGTTIYTVSGIPKEDDARYPGDNNGGLDRLFTGKTFLDKWIALRGYGVNMLPREEK